MTELLEEEDAVDDFEVEANTVFNNGNADDNDQSDTAHNAIDSEDEELAEESEHESDHLQDLEDWKREKEWVEEEDIDINIDGLDVDRSFWITEADIQDAAVDSHHHIRRRRLGRDRSLMVASALSVLLYSHSRWNNTMQAMLGVWANAVHIPKRAINTLNRYGVLVSYDTTRKGLRAVARWDREMLQAKIENNQPFGIFWDNLVRSDRKEEETITNRRLLEQNTSAFVHFLHLPEPPDECPELRTAYRNVLVALDKAKGIGLPRSLLYRPLDEDDIIPVNKHDFLFDGALGDHIRIIAHMRIGQVLQKIYGADTLGVFKVDHQKLDLPNLPKNYVRMVPHQSDLHCLPTMGLDETTIDGTAMVLEDMMEYCGVELGKLNDRAILASGDQMSNARTRKLKELGIHDEIQERHEWAIQKPGPLHISMAYLQGFMKCHMLGKSGKDPTSLARFAAMLARSRLSEDGKMIDFNAANRFVTQAWEAHVLAAAVCQSRVGSSDGAGSVKDLGEWLKTHNWVKLIDDVVQTYFPTQKVAHQRELAQRKARHEYLDIRKKVLEIPAQSRTAAEKEFLGMCNCINYKKII